VRFTSGVGPALATVLSAFALAGGYPPPSSQGLVPARGYSWLCAGAALDRTCRGHVPRRLRRPLHLPTLAAGTSCPRSGARHVSPSFGIALGPGPAYPVPFRDGILQLGDGRVEGGWMYVKVLWVTAPRYAGPFLVRGRRIDGTSWLGFESGPHPLQELQFPPRPRGYRGWRSTATYTRVREPGCYAYQVDGTTFSRVLVFSIEH
jgi:hypothetical protein